MTNVLLAVLFLAGQAPAVDKKVAIQGEWKVVSVEGDGPAKLLKENVERILIDAEHITAGRAADYTMDAEKKTIDMTLAAGPKAEQGKYLGIYELKGDELKLHFGLPGKDRPAGFEKKEGAFIISLKKK